MKEVNADLYAPVTITRGQIGRSPASKRRRYRRSPGIDTTVKSAILPWMVPFATLISLSPGPLPIGLTGSREVNNAKLSKRVQSLTLY